jgi:hypothetical protein
MIKDPRLPANPGARDEYLRLLNIRLNELFKDIYDTMGRFSSEITLADSSQLDSFGRLRTSIPTTLFDSQQEYGLCTRRCWDGVVYDASVATASYTITSPSANGSITNAAGSAVGPTNTNTRMTPITVAADDGDYAILQSRQYVRYIPGKSHLVLMTGIFATGSGATAAIVRRTSTSGSVVDNEVLQSAWNIDKLDGTGPSRVTIDFTKTQILVIDAQWLGVGRVRVGFDVDGVIVVAHEFLNANVLTVPYTQHFNLPLRLDVRTVTTTAVARVGYFDHANGIFLKTTRATAGGTIQFICASVQSEGGEESRGFPRIASNGITAIGVTARRPVLSIRNAATYNSLVNRTHIEMAEAEISAATNNAFYEIVIGGTLTGASFATVGTDSAAEFDIAATAISGGLTVASGFVLAGTGVTRGLSSSGLDFRNPLTISKIDALATTQPAISIVCTSFTGTSNIVANMHWHEQVV